MNGRSLPATSRFGGPDRRLPFESADCDARGLGVLLLTNQDPLAMRGLAQKSALNGAILDNNQNSILKKSGRTKKD